MYVRMYGGYCGNARNDSHSNTNITMFINVSKCRTVVVVLTAAQWLRLDVYVTGPFPAVLTAVREQSCCKVSSGRPRAMVYR